MKKKLSFLIALLLISGQAAQAKPLSSDLVDLHKNHWAYGAATKIVDKYGLIKGFPDHTFRGEKGVNRYEFSVIILNLIKYMEDKRKISFKPLEGISVSYNNKSLADIPKTFWAQAAIMELKDNYNLILSPPSEKAFAGNKNINRLELAYAIDKVISLATKKDLMDKNPYEQPAEPLINPAENTITPLTPEQWAENSIKNLTDYKIMVGFTGSGNFNGNGEVNRYQLASVLVKAIEYIEKNWQINI
jgi:hypothetical protein